ncbi:MAG: hypothetical protein EBU77_11030 [Betaproteobacteria bacterium]|nr:hypothetical protein [Betaproteobacteria bacterium]
MCVRVVHQKIGLLQPARGGPQLNKFPAVGVGRQNGDYSLFSDAARAWAQAWALAQAHWKL